MISILFFSDLSWKVSFPLCFSLETDKNEKQNSITETMVSLPIPWLDTVHVVVFSFEVLIKNRTLIKL